MAKIEEGKYYVDGEGFYKCIGKEENHINKKVRMDTVLLREKSVSFYSNMSYVENACERRMVECSKEDYNYALEQAESFINKMYEFNTKVFKPLWDNKDSNNG